MELLSAITMVLLPLGTLAAGGIWGYTGQYGPGHWAENFKECAGKRQSPININTLSVKPVYWMPFSFENYEVPANIMRVSNNGHSAKIVFEGEATPVVRHGGLKDDYIFAQLHFHWGSDQVQGSEHTIDGVRYPLEMHIVNFKKEYASLGESVKHGDGLAVLGIMFEVGETDNAAFTPLIKTLANITDAGMVAEVSNPYPLQAYLPDSTEKFFRYDGSLTTPTCNEAVVWTVFDETVKISRKQLKALRSLKTEGNYTMVNNYRPPQPLNNRQVLVSGVGSGADSMKTMSLALYFISAITVIKMSM